MALYFVITFSLAFCLRGNAFWLIPSPRDTKDVCGTPDTPVYTLKPSSVGRTGTRQRLLETLLTYLTSQVHPEVTNHFSWVFLKDNSQTGIYRVWRKPYRHAWSRRRPLRPTIYGLHNDLPCGGWIDKM